MEEFEQTSPEIQHRPYRKPAGGPAAPYLELRIAELEMENLRLQRLVTELLFKNQELRKQLCQ